MTYTQGDEQVKTSHTVRRRTSDMKDELKTKLDALQQALEEIKALENKQEDIINSLPLSLQERPNDGEVAYEDFVLIHHSRNPRGTDTIRYRKVKGRQPIIEMNHEDEIAASSNNSDIFDYTIYLIPVILFAIGYYVGGKTSKQMSSFERLLVEEEIELI